MCTYKWKNGKVEKTDKGHVPRSSQLAVGFTSLIHVDRTKWEQIFSTGVGHSSTVTKTKGKYDSGTRQSY